MIPTREQAETLFLKYNKTESLYKHAIAVEAVMRHFAEIYNEDPEKWGIIGFVHDLDWEAWPEEHCKKTPVLLKEAGWPQDWIDSILSHAWGMCSDIEPQHVMEKVLYATDELTGLIIATALMRPSKSLMDMEARSVKKKWKDKRFAAGVDRAIIDKGAAMLSMERSELIEKTIEAMKKVADRLNLA